MATDNNVMYENEGPLDPVVETEEERQAGEMFGPWMPAVEEVVRAIDEARKHWPESDDMFLALIATLDRLADRLDLDCGRSRTNRNCAKWLVEVPSALDLWSAWRRRVQEHEEREARGD
jgi:hypothetical protein